jgi:hypothetical protein
MPRLIASDSLVEGERDEEVAMLIHCFFGAALLGLCVGLLAIVGAGSSNDPFAALSRIGAYFMITAAIAGGACAGGGGGD